MNHRKNVFDVINIQNHSIFVDGSWINDCPVKSSYQELDRKQDMKDVSQFVCEFFINSGLQKNECEEKAE